LLATFTKIGKETFPQATETMLDMSAALGQDMKSSAIQLGKALNDPILGVTALRRVGVQLSKQQEQQIKRFVQMGDIVSAQKIILGELNTQMGGVAKTMAQTKTGGLKQFMNALSDLGEELGAIIAEYITPLVKWLKDLFNSFRGLDEGTKKMIVTLGLFAAAIGPLSTGIGGLLKGFSLILAHPVGAAIAALAAGFIALGFAIKGAIDEAERFNRTISKGLEAAQVADNIRKGEKVGLDIARKAYNDLETAINNNYKEVLKYEEALKDEGKTIHDMTDAQKEDYNRLVAKQDKLVEGQEIIGKYIKVQEKLEKQEKGKKKTIDNTNKSLEEQYKLFKDIDQALKDSIVREIIAETGERLVSSSQIFKKFQERQGNVIGSNKTEKTQVEVAIKLTADKGTEATIEDVKKPKGNSEVKFINETYLGMRPL